MIAVIGDIHGCFLTLQKLVDKIRSVYDEIDLYCVGDLVDRGNFSYEVMEFVKDNKIVFTPGNHDYMFYYHIKDPSHPIGKPWIHNGCEPTLKSYQERWEKMDQHLEIIKKSPLVIDHKDCFISHAGISDYFSKKLGNERPFPSEKLSELAENELLSEHSIIWNRDNLLDIGRLQVVGHTRMAEVRHNEISNSLYIDTAAVAGNKLSAAIVEDHKMIDVVSEETNKMDIVKTSF